MTSHEIDYRIYGEEMQFVEIELDPQEGVIAEAGSFMMMDEGITMETIFGDGSQKDQGFLGKILGAGKRILTGESLFMTAFYNDISGKRNVSFASPYPGKIVPIDLTEFGGKFICQKDAFLCAAKGVSVGIEFSKKLGRGLFGGEGFIMQKLEGDGMAFVHACGTTAKRILAPGEVMRVDTGCIVGFTQDVDYDIEFIPSKDNVIREASVIGCISHKYFKDHLLVSKGYPILMTTNLMAPEAYVIESVIESWLELKIK